MTPLGKSTKVRDAIFGNVGTIIVFRVGAEDGEFLEKEFQPEFSAEDLINLEKYNICIKLMIDGITSSPFSAITLPLKEKPQKSYKDTIIRASRERYGTERKIIEGKIEKWAETVKQISLTPKPVLYDAQCSVCGKKIKVPFQPDSSRSVYCQSCSKKVEKEKEKEITLSSLPPRTTKPKEKKEIKVDEIKKVLEKILKKNEEDK
jgi:CxxC-x17-CxxC domain-containing protein